MADAAWDDEFDEPPPPSSQEEELEYQMSIVTAYLDQVSKNEDIAWALCNALNGVRDNVRKRFPVRPNASDRDRMLAAVTRARIGAMANLPQSYSRAQIAVGFDALAGLICWWSESDSERARRQRHVFGELVDYVKMLRNDVENMATAQDMRERAHSRRAALINELRRSAVAWTAS